MTETSPPYDAGLHTGFQPIARCGDIQIGRWNGTVYLLRDDDSRARVCDLPRIQTEHLVAELAELVGQLRDGLVAVGQEGDLPPGPLTLAAGAVAEIPDG